MDGSSCIAPNSDTNETLINNIYSFEGFTRLTSTWIFSGFSTNTVQCNLRTLLGGDQSNGVMKIKINDIPAVYAIRIKTNFFFLGGDGTTKSINFKIYQQGTTTPTFTSSVAASQNANSHDTCLGTQFIMHAVDETIDFTGFVKNTDIYIEIWPSVNVDWGLREVYVIAYKCDPSCSKCDGPEATKC